VGEGARISVLAGVGLAGVETGMSGLAVSARVTAVVWAGVGVIGFIGVPGGEDGEGVTLPVPEEQAASSNKDTRARTRSDLFNTLLRFKRP